MNVLKWYGIFHTLTDAVRWANAQGNILQFQIIPEQGGYMVVILVEQQSNEEAAPVIDEWNQHEWGPNE